MTCLSLALFSLLGVTPAAAPPVPDTMATLPFEERAKSILPTLAMQFVANRIVLGPDELGGMYEECRGFKGFHDGLPNALRSTDSATRRAALGYLILLASLARGSAWELDRDEGDDALERVLGRTALPIRTSLERLVKMAKGEDGLHASVALLALNPVDRAASDILVPEMQAEDAKRRKKACELVSSLRLSHPRIITALGAALRAKDREVRLMAAEAAWRIGPKAGKVVPDLVSLLERGKDGWGMVRPFAVLALPQKCNLPLQALSEMGDAARTAVPVMARMLKGADQEMQLALLSCLGRLGTSAESAAPAVRQSMRSDDSEVRILAAVVLLCMKPGDAKAGEAVVTVLNGKDGKQRKQALEPTVRS